MSSPNQFCITNIVCRNGSILYLNLKSCDASIPQRKSLVSLLNSVNNPMSMREAACPLSEDVHGHSSQHNRDSNTANDKETVAHTLKCNPVIDVESQSKSEHVLDKVHDGKCLG
jgi:hypothetical protein